MLECQEGMLITQMRLLDGITFLLSAHTLQSLDWQFFLQILYILLLRKKLLLKIPWGVGATTLEWTVPSPPNFHTFEELPKFEDDQDTQKSHG